MSAALNANNDSSNNLLEGVPDHIKERLLDLSQQIDLVESIVNLMDSTPTNELHENVILLIVIVISCDISRNIGA